MRPSPRDFVEAARCPDTIPTGEFGMWTIERRQFAPGSVEADMVGYTRQTALRHITEASMHTAGEIVMEDSRRELQKHLPIWLAASGRVLVTGLGLGCVVRGLLIKPEVEHIDVVEVDAHIIDLVGREFAGNARVSLHQGDALSIDLPGSWHFGWHDLWIEGQGLQLLHAKLFKRFKERCGPQGAWAFPRSFSRAYRRHFDLIGVPR